VIVLVLGAGGGEEVDTPPLWLLENDGMLLVERFARACLPLKARLVFAVRQQEIRRHRVDHVMALAAPGSTVIAVAGETAGAACTALLCISQIQPERELLLLSGNEFIDIDYAAVIEDFRRRSLDAGVVIFPSIHPRYSHVRMDDDLVVEASEKHPISHDASAGFAWYRRGRDFLDSAQDMIRKDAHVDGRFFISLALNEMVLRKKRVGVHRIETHQYHPLKSLRQRAAFEAEKFA
jgi:hypothetical protein